MPAKENSEIKRRWTFFSNHFHVYLVLAQNKNIVLRDVAQMIGITERSVQNIVKDLADEGYIKIVKSGRENSYSMVPNKRLRHPLEESLKLGDLVKIFD